MFHCERLWEIKMSSGHGSIPRPIPRPGLCVPRAMWALQPGNHPLLSHGGVFRFSRLFEYLGPRVLASAAQPFTPSRCAMLVVPVNPPATAPTLPLLPGAIHTDLLVFDTGLIRLLSYYAQDFFKNQHSSKTSPLVISLKKILKGKCSLCSRQEHEENTEIV